MEKMRKLPHKTVLDSPPPMGGCMDVWVVGLDNGWVDGSGQVKSLKIE